MSMPANVTPFDPRPLLEPVDRSAAQAFTRQLRAEGRLPGTVASNVIAIVVLAVFGVVFLFIFGIIGIGVIATVLSASAPGAAPAALLISAVPAILIVGFIALGVVLIVRNLGTAAVRRYRLDRFARANSMGYLPVLQNPALPGMIFSLGSSRTAHDLVRGEHPRFVEFANYTYETGSGKNRTTYRWGYVAVKLDVPLPNIVLDATSNNGLFGASNLPASFDRHQRLSLEGDFDQHFSLYCPRGYERDALYLFTPDIMARFIDHASALDVEIVDDWLFLYARRDFSTLDPATWAWLFSVVGALLDKLAQWARWRDDRLAMSALAPPAGPDALPAIPGPPVDVAAAPAGAVAAASALPFAPPAGLLRPPPGVAPPGRRLRQKVPWAVWVVLGGFLLFWLLSSTGFFGAVLGMLFG